MGKNRATRQNIKLLNSSNIVKITRESEHLLFEIGDETTTDVAEAVAIMMRYDVGNNIWNSHIVINSDSVEPRRSLYWLSGGDNEWMTLENYNKPWQYCDLEFQEEFGFMIISIVKKSKTLGDIRDGFMKYLNLPTLYEFALSREFIR